MRKLYFYALLAPVLALMTNARAQDVAPDEKAEVSIEKAIEQTSSDAATDDAELTPAGGEKVEFETVPYVEDKALLPDTTTIIPRVAGVNVPELDGTAGATTGATQNNSLADRRLQAGVAQPILNLTDSIQMTLQNNPQRALARAQLEASLSSIGIAKAAGGLQIDVNGSLNTQRGFFGSGSTTNIGGTGTGGTGTGGIGTGGTGTGTGGTGTGGTGTGGTGTGGTGTGTGGGTNVDPTIPGQFFNTGNSSQSLSVGAVLPIYTGGRVKASKRAAQASARAQAALTLQTEQDLVSNATAGYLTILRREQLLTVAESDLAVSQERRRVAEVRFVGGAAPRSDVLRADATLAAARQRRVQAASDVATSKSNLNVLMGRLPETPFSVIPIVGFTPRVTIAAATGTDTFPTIDGQSSAELRALADLNRPTLAAQREQINVAEANVEVARAARKPSISASLTGALRNPASFLGRFTLGLGASIAQLLFDSGRTGYQIRQAREVVQQTQQNLQNQNLQVAGTIEQNVLAIDTSQQKLGDTEAGVIAAAGALRAAQVGYRAGTLTSVDVSDAQRALLQAQTDAVNANFDLASARVNLAASVGVLSPEAQTAYDAVLDEELRRGARIQDDAPAKKPAAAKKKRRSIK